ncbi:DUF397 domain-containing protein [Streptomyces syringium]|uniref:DUF397 domain-containing protein n=1 Tax=Streptomyces syringium TaxID=76729 RepID=UPI00369C5DB1
MNNRKLELYTYDLSGAAWRKSSVSGAEHNCVEVADLANGTVAIRDSKDPRRTPLRFHAAEWATFRQSLISGDICPSRAE